MGQTSSMKKILLVCNTFCLPKQGSAFLLALEGFSFLKTLFRFLKPFCIYPRYSTDQWNFFSQLGFTDDYHIYLSLSALAYLLKFHLNDTLLLKQNFSYSQLFLTLISKFSLNYTFFLLSPLTTITQGIGEQWLWSDNLFLNTFTNL